jgi:hypothetical protein
VFNCASSAYFNCVGACAAHTDWTIVPGNYTWGDNSSLGQASPNEIFSCGSSGSPIVIQAANIGGAIIDGGLTTPYYSFGTAAAGDGVLASDTAFDFEGSCSYLTIKGFVFQNFFHSGGLMNGNVEDHITWSQNIFQNIGNETSCIPSASSTCASGGTGSTFGIEGVYAGRVPTGATVTSNITWDRNLFSNIGRTACTPTPCTNDYSHDHGLYLYDGPYIITNNIFYGMNAGWNIQFAPGSHSMTVVGNTFIGGANPVKDGCMMLWTENTSDGDGVMGISNLTLNNNIFTSCTNYASDYFTDNTATFVNLVFQNNLIGNASAANSASWCTPNGTTCSWSITPNTTGTNPTFVSGGSHNYHLTNSSAGINIGISVTDPFDYDGNPRPLGGAYDMGAYEVVPSPIFRSWAFLELKDNILAALLNLLDLSQRQ